ncbi:MAG: N-acylneuraminate [Desulfovibrionaceae bacterium]|nr:MAG: N-acylneuraminate [Desulfovibrionaceae bacterium]
MNNMQPLTAPTHPSGESIPHLENDYGHMARSVEHLFPCTHHISALCSHAVQPTGSVKRPRVVAIIPARGGSKGLPRKNALPLCGKPLVAYSIEAALGIEGVDRVVVSTEDEEIAAIARSYGRDVALKRPLQLAGDQSRIEDTISNVYLKLKAEGYDPDMNIVLLPTHPFRNRSLMNSLAHKGMEGRRPVFTARDLTRESYWHDGGDGLFRKLSSYGSSTEKMLRPYGLFSCGSPSLTEAPFVHILEDPISLIDIDYAEDFLLAEEIIKNNMFDFG